MAACGGLTRLRIARCAGSSSSRAAKLVGSAVTGWTNGRRESSKSPSGRPPPACNRFDAKALRRRARRDPQRAPAAADWAQSCLPEFWREPPKCRVAHGPTTSRAPRQKGTTPTVRLPARPVHHASCVASPSRRSRTLQPTTHRAAARSWPGQRAWYWARDSSRPSPRDTQSYRYAMEVPPRGAQIPKAIGSWIRMRGSRMRCANQSAKSATDLPASSAACSHFGLSPRPDQAAPDTGS